MHYAKKFSALTKALSSKEERQEAAETLRGLIEKIPLAPGPERGEIYATLHGAVGHDPQLDGAATHSKGNKNKHSRR